MHNIDAHECIAMTAMGTKVYYPSTKFSQINRRAHYTCRWGRSDRQYTMEKGWKKDNKGINFTTTLLQKQRLTEMDKIQANIITIQERIKQLENLNCNKEQK